MKLPNGYGSVTRMGRRRRNQYAARVTVGWTDDGKQIKKYLGFFPTRQEALNALANYNQNPFDVVYAAAYKNLAPPHEMIFSRIRKRHIQTVIDECPLKVQAKAHMKTVCTQMFKCAIDMEIVTTNFAELVELPTREDSEIHKPFTGEELSTL